MNSFAVDDPLYLWLLVPVCILMMLGAGLFAAMSPARRWVAVVVRCVLLALLLACVAGLADVRRTQKVAVIAVIDTSDSVRRLARPLGGAGADGSEASIERVRAELRGLLRGRTAEDYFGVVTFDGRALAVAAPSASDVLSRDMQGTPSPGTNIEGALRLAASLAPPDATTRLLLMSDGNQTMGDALSFAAEQGAARSTAGRGGLPIDVSPVSYVIDAEVVLDSLDVPAVAPATGAITLRLVLDATKDSTGTIRVLREGVPMLIGRSAQTGAPETGRRVRLAPGRTVERIEVTLPPGRVHRFRAIYEPDEVETAAGVGMSGDTITENNSADGFTMTPGSGSVLIVDGVSNGAGPEGPLAQTLRSQGMDVRIVAPGAVPSDPLTLAGLDLIVLDNVAADDVPEEEQRALVGYVRDVGGGLIMVGGPASFGAGGWRGSELEPILPVRLDLPERLIAPSTAILLVLDNSGSMRRSVLGTGRTQQEIANDAAALAIRSLDPRDQLGIVTFESTADVVVPIGLLGNGKLHTESVRAIDSGGGTNVVDALEKSIEQFDRVPDAKVKHLILLSDGVSRRKDRLMDRVDELRARGVLVSAVAVGDGADLEMMRQMAERGGGTYYHAQSASLLPRLLLKAVRLVRTPYVREEPFQPRIIAPESAYVAGMSSIPMLNGLTLTMPSASPDVTTAMVTTQGEPVLAHRQVGLGQVVAFTSDAHHWAAPWLATDVYRQFWGQAARLAARTGSPSGLTPLVQVDSGRVRVMLEARDDAGVPLNSLAVPATVYLPSGERHEVQLSQVGPGAYESSFAADETGSYVALLRPSLAGKPLVPTFAGTSAHAGAELRARRSNDELLTQIAAASGGRVINTSEPASVNLFDRAGLVPRETLLPLWRSLLVAAIAALLADITVRRLAWDRWVSRRFNPDVAGRPVIAGAGVADVRRDFRSRIETATSLGEDDADSLRAAARDRRRAIRLGQQVEPDRSRSGGGGAGGVGVASRAGTQSSSVEPDSGLNASRGASRADNQGSDSTEPPETGLLAAKRRAKQRFDDEK